MPIRSTIALSTLLPVCALLAPGGALSAQADPPSKPADTPKQDQARPGDKIDFEKQILPILEKNCVECHREPYVTDGGRRKRPKGGVIFETRKGIEKSKRGKVVVAGKPGRSLMVHAITLPADDEDRMPPAKEGDPLPKEQIELIQKWIEQGANFGKWTGEKKDGDKPAGGKDDGDDDGDEPEDDKGGKKDGDKPKPPKEDDGDDDVDLAELAGDLAPLGDDARNALLALHAQVLPVEADNPLVRVSFYGSEREVDDEALAQLAAVREHVVELVLARTSVTDAGMTTLAGFPRLCHLDLRETRVGDTGAEALASLPNLRSLNLFATEVGDRGTAALAANPTLQTLCLWQTPVSAEAVVAFRAARPDTEVVFAPDLPEPMAAEETGRGRRRR